MKPATSNLASRWGLPMPIIKSHAEEKWAWPWATEASQNFWAPFNISAMAEASDFKFDVLLVMSDFPLFYYCLYFYYPVFTVPCVGRLNDKIAGAEDAKLCICHSVIKSFQFVCSNIQVISDIAR